MQVPPRGDGAHEAGAPEPGKRRPVAVAQPPVTPKQGAVQIRDQQSSASSHRVTSFTLGPGLTGLRYG